MTKKIMVPDIQFEGFEKEWEITLLSKLMTFSNGINAPKESYGKGRKMISVLDILDDSPLKYEGIRNSVSVNEDVENSSRVDKGDLVFVRSSEVVSEVGWGKAYLDEKYALYSGFSIRGKRKDKYEALFLELSINEKARKQIERRSGGSTRFNVNQSILNELKVSMPSLDEQKEISHIFKILNTNINSRKHELTKLQNFKQAMLQKMFPKEGEKEPEVRFEGFSGEWGKTKLNDIAKVYQPTTIARDKLIQGRYPVFGANGYIGYHDEYNHRERQVVISCRGEKSGTVNFVREFAWITGNSMVVNIDDSSEILKEYLYYLLSSQNLKYMVTGSGQPQITRKSVLDHSIINPSIKEQKVISEYFNELDKHINSKQKQLEKLKQFKKAMLQKMFV